MKQIVILEIPTNLGLYEPAPGKEPGVKKLPFWLRDHGFYSNIMPVEVVRIEPPPYTMIVYSISGVRNAKENVLYFIKEAEFVIQYLKSDRFIIAIGGD